jgi:N-acetylmuramoyl-L-alanine amidase
MNLQKLIFTNNACFKAGRTIVPKGIMVHSTGANNPNLRRYVNPDDGLLGQNTSGNHWNQDRPDGRQVCVHAFIGKLANGSVATYQTLPWNHRGWHGGGDSNNTHIGFEICEDALADAVYFRAVFTEAVGLCAYLCKEYQLDPMKDGVIIGHFEGFKRGIASNHADPGHWFPKHGENMDTFRAAVKRLLGGGVPAPPPVPQPSVTRPTLRRGATGVDVVFMQQRLAVHGFPLLADGSFNAATEEAVKKFQIARKLVSDGICGVRTWAALEAVPPALTREECRAVIQAACHFSDPAGVWAAIETHKYADDLYRRFAAVML